MSLLRHKSVLVAAFIFLLALVFVVSEHLLGAPTPAAADPQATARLLAQGFTAIQLARQTGDPANYAQADSAFSAILATDPSNKDALIGQGSLLLARHQFRDAETLGQKLVALAPNTALAYGVLGDAQVELGQYDAAAKTIQKMVDLRPDLSSYSRGSYLRELHGDVAGAIDLMQQALESGSSSVENVEWVRVQLGNLYFNKGDLAAAEYQYQASLAHLPGYLYALEGLGKVRAAQGRYPEAISNFQQAQLKVPLPQIVIELGETEAAAGQAKAAGDQYGLAQVIEKLFVANGVNQDMELALFEADHGAAPQAVTDARKAYAERPSIKAADTLAWALSQAGQQAEAQKYSKEALRLGWQDALMFYHAGMIAYRAGNMEEARARLAQALAVNPYFSPLYAAQARQTLAQAQAR